MAAKTKTPAARYLRYELTNSGTPGTETSHFIDLAKDLSDFQGRSWHDLPAIGRLHVFGQKIWKGITRTCCTVGNVHIDGSGLQAGVVNTGWNGFGGE